MTALIVLLFVVAFVCARIMRSTKMWWSCIIAILAGLLIGITSKYVVSDSNDEELTVVTTDFSSNQNEYMQCTFDDAIALLEDTNIVGYTYFEEPKRLDGYNKRPIIGAREPPGIEDDS